jgi:DNA-binding NtrC family response regulator
MAVAHILVVDDEPDIRELVRDILVDEGYDVTIAENVGQARLARRQRRPDLVLLDIWMPDVDGISLLREWSTERDQNIPVIMISGHGTVETAVEATRLGAYDFLEKPLSLAKLLLTVRHALEVRRLQQENLDLRRVAQPLNEPLGGSGVIQTLRQQVQLVAQHNAWVLLSGEPGSGLELFARYLHACSPRSDGPFIDVRVASIAGENAAVELFGSEDSGRIHYGLLEQANGGTLFLDEVGDMDAAVQARLFSTLENRSFLRVWGVEPVRFDVRVVAASHRDLEAEVAAGRFRGDLYYQLNVVPLRVPPLREHSEDVPELLDYYVNLFASQEHLPYRSFSVAAQNRLRNHPWAGNVRELKNLVQRLLILGAGDEVSLPDVEMALGVSHRDQVVAAFAMPLREARAQFEKEYFEYHLRLSEDNIGAVARKAGIERTHLYRKLLALGIRSKP